MSHQRNTDPTPTVCFAIQASAEPSVLPRLVELFAKRGLLPTALHSRCHETLDGPVNIDIEMTGLDRSLANYLQRSMRQVIGVDVVLISEKHRV